MTQKRLIELGIDPQALHNVLQITYSDKAQKELQVIGESAETIQNAITKHKNWVMAKQDGCRDNEIKLISFVRNKKRLIEVAFVLQNKVNVHIIKVSKR